jgi:hypothetical protein
MNFIVLIILILVFILIDYFTKINSRIFLYSLFFISLIFLHISDYTIVVDYENYVNFFKAVTVDWRVSFLYNYEIGYIVYNIILSFFTSNYNMVFLISYCLCLFLFTKRFETHSPYSVISFFCIICVYYIDSPLRQMIASAIFIFSLKYLYQKKAVYFFYAFIAFSFHYIAILLFPLYFIANRYYSAKIYIGLILFSLVCCYFVDFTYYFRIVNNLFGKNYFDIQRSPFTAGLLGILLQLTIFSISLYYLKINKNNTFYVMLFNINTLGVIIYLTFHSITILATRGSEMLTVIQCILLPYILFLSKIRYNKTVILIFILLTYIYIYWGNVNETFRYKDAIINMN